MGGSEGSDSPDDLAGSATRRENFDPGLSSDGTGTNPLLKSHSFNPPPFPPSRIVDGKSRVPVDRPIQVVVLWFSTSGDRTRTFLFPLPLRKAHDWSPSQVTSRPPVLPVVTTELGRLPVPIVRDLSRRLISTGGKGGGTPNPLTPNHTPRRPPWS